MSPEACNRGNLEHFDIFPNFYFATGETERDYQ